MVFMISYKDNEEEIVIRIPVSELSYWDEKNSGWALEKSKRLWWALLPPTSPAHLSGFGLTIQIYALSASLKNHHPVRMMMR
jgi:hypothetical protein